MIFSLLGTGLLYLHFYLLRYAVVFIITYYAQYNSDVEDLFRKTIRQLTIVFRKTILLLSFLVVDLLCTFRKFL